MQVGKACWISDYTLAASDIIPEHKIECYSKYQNQPYLRSIGISSKEQEDPLRDTSTSQGRVTLSEDFESQPQTLPKPRTQIYILTPCLDSCYSTGPLSAMDVCPQGSPRAKQIPASFFFSQSDPEKIYQWHDGENGAPKLPTTQGIYPPQIMRGKLIDEEVQQRSSC